MTLEKALTQAHHCATTGIIRRPFYVVYNPSNPSLDHRNRYETRPDEDVFDGMRNLIYRVDTKGNCSDLRPIES